jgi:hypothetical protein
MVTEQKDIPEQHEGAKSDIYYDVHLSTEQEAQRKYVEARSNLLSINHWHEFAGKLSARFMLTDPAGIQVERLPLEGDYIKIHLPVSSADKFEWVRIEKLHEENPDDKGLSRIVMRVRPAEAPREITATKHFFSPDATSNFIVERSGTRVAAMVLGRNELPNLEPESVMQKVRNTAIAIGAMLGLNTPQWKGLVKGIIEQPSDAV